MSTVTKPPSPPVLLSQVPSLDELYEMTSEPGHRVVIPDVDWAFYEQLVDSIPESTHIRVDYDGKDVEIMVLNFRHDESKRLLGRVAEIVAEECEIPIKSAGSTTWKRPEVDRGLESDESYFFQAEKLAAIAAAKARNSRDIADYPNPDLGIEVDYSPSKIDRPGIYAALRVAEVWRFDGERVFIDRLTANGTYELAQASQFLPLTAEEIRRWVVDEDTSDESAWARRLRAWARAELAPRRTR
jgi:Uma2 family endonuclease